MMGNRSFAKHQQHNVIVTVEPPNKSQVGTLTDVHYLEVVLYWFFWSKILYFTFYNILGRILDTK